MLMSVAVYILICKCSVVIMGKINALPKIRLLPFLFGHHVTNIEVLNRAGIKKKTFQQNMETQNNVFGHITTQEGIQRDILKGMMEDKRGRGRPRATWTDNIKAWTGKCVIRSDKNGSVQTSVTVRDSRPSERRWHHVMMTSMTADLPRGDGIT